MIENRFQKVAILKRAYFSEENSQRLNKDGRGLGKCGISVKIMTFG
jgi:hypothetical protein